MGKFSQARAEANTAPESQDDGEKQAQETAAQKPRAKAGVRKASAEGPELFLSVGDSSFPIPPGTPLYKRALAVVEALYAE